MTSLATELGAYLSSPSTYEMARSRFAERPPSIALIAVSPTRARIYTERGICKEYNAAINRPYRCEVKFHALFCEGYESKRMLMRMFLEFKDGNFGQTTAERTPTSTESGVPPLSVKVPQDRIR